MTISSDVPSRCLCFNSNTSSEQLRHAVFRTDSTWQSVPQLWLSLRDSLSNYSLLCNLFRYVSYTISHSNHHLKLNVFLEYPVSDVPIEWLPSIFNTVRVSLNIYACKSSMFLRQLNWCQLISATLLLFSRLLRTQKYSGQIYLYRCCGHWY